MGPDVSIGAALQFTFNEPLAAPGSGSVVVRTDPGGSSLAATVALSGDALTVTVQPSATPPVAVLVDLTGLTDVAGNHVTEAPIPYRYPTWVAEPDPLVLDTTLAVSLAIDGTQPVIGFRDQQAKRTYVLRLEGGAWNRLGQTFEQGINVATNDSTDFVVLNARDGVIAVLWCELIAQATYSTYLKRWNGTNWDLLGTNVASGYLNDGSLALDAVGDPWVALNKGTLRTMHWTGSAWSDVGTWSSATRYSPYIAFGAGDIPYLSLIATNSSTLNKEVQVHKWSGAAWAQLSGAFPFVNYVQTPFVDDGGTLRLISWDSGNYVASFAFNGATWGAGEPINASVHRTAAFPKVKTFAAGADGMYVAWIDNENEIYVARRDTSGWTTLPMVFGGGVGVFDIGGVAAAPGVGPWVAWVDFNYKPHVYRLNR